MSQIWSEIHGTNEIIRTALRARQLLTGKEHTVTSLERVDLTAAQKQDARFYPDDHVIVFNQKSGLFARGEKGRFVLVTSAGAIVEANGTVQFVKTKHFDRFSVCRPRALTLCPGDRIQLKCGAGTEFAAPNDSTMPLPTALALGEQFPRLGYRAICGEP